MRVLEGDSLAASIAKGVVLMLSACVPSACVIISTPKSGIGSLPRYCFLPILAAVSKQLLQGLQGITGSLAIDNVFIGIVALFLLQCCNLLAIARLDADDLVGGTIFQPSDGFLYKLFGTTCLIFNLRGVGTPWQPKNLNRFPEFYTLHSNGGKPTRTAFIVRQLMIISWQYVLLDMTHVSSLDATPEENDRLFGPGSEFMYLNATAEQWAGRVIVGVISALVPARVAVDIYYRILSVVAVVLGITPPEQWPPLFGTLRDIYTIRGVWGKFWHKYIRWSHVSISKFVYRDLLRLPRPSPLERYVNIVVVFAVTGIVHVVFDSYGAAPPSKLPTFAFFMSMPMAIMIEDGVQQIYRRVTGADTRNGKQEVPIWHKAVGYLWVSLWMSLTAPWFMYHNTRMAADDRRLVPFSVIPLMGRLAANVFLVVGGLVLKVAVGGEV